MTKVAAGIALAGSVDIMTCVHGLSALAKYLRGIRLSGNLTHGARHPAALTIEMPAIVRFVEFGTHRALFSMSLEVFE